MAATSAATASASAALTGSSSFEPDSTPTEAELPRVYIDTTYELPTGGTTWQVPSAYTLQQAIDGAALGDVIVVDSTATLTGPFVLKNKASGTGWIYIISSAMASLPVEGNRVAPSDAANMPTLQSATASGEYVIGAEAGAHHYRLAGLEIRPAAETYLYGLISWAWDEDTLTDFPHDVTIDRCYLHGDATAGTRRGISANGASIAIVDSYLVDFNETGQDTQCIDMWTGTGPYKVHNCYLEAATENICFGGADPQVEDLVPSDIEITGNYIFKPLAWQSSGTAEYKNLLELKLGVRVLIEGNVLENNWLDAQAGYAVLFTVRNQNGGAPWSAVTDVTFRYNKVLNVSQGFSIHGRDRDTGIASQQEARINIHDNVVSVANLSDGSEGRIFTALLELKDLSIQHNTVFSARSGGTALMMYTTSGSYLPDGLVFRDNIIQMGDYGFFGVIEGGSSAFAEAALDLLYVDSWECDHNALVELTEQSPSQYPDGNWFPAAMANVGFVDLGGGDYHLAVTSPYYGAASDSTDVGADIDAVDLATLHAIDGQTVADWSASVALSAAASLAAASSSIAQASATISAAASLTPASSAVAAAAVALSASSVVSPSSSAVAAVSASIASTSAFAPGGSTAGSSVEITVDEPDASEALYCRVAFACSGTCTAGSAVAVYTSDGGTKIGDATVDGTSWSYSWNPTYAHHTVTNPCFVATKDGQTAKQSVAVTVTATWQNILAADRVWDNAHRTVSSGLVTQLDEACGSGLHLTNSNASSQPTAWDSDSGFGGYPSSGNDSGTVVWLSNSNNTAHNQPCSIIYVYRYTTDTNDVLTATNSSSGVRLRHNGSLAIAAGTEVYTHAVAAYAYATIVQLNGSSSTYHSRRRDGTEYGPTTFNPGTNGLIGPTVLNDREHATPTYHRSALLVHKFSAIDTTQESEFWSMLHDQMGFTV